MQSRQLQVGDLVFDALVDGPADGRLVLLLHGFPQTSWSWRHVIPGLAAAGFRVVAPDQRGYSPGARPESVAQYRMPHLLADVVGMVAALGVDRRGVDRPGVDRRGVDRMDVVGHDWGAAVAWQLAGRHPELVRTLTAVSVPHPLAFVAALRGDEDQRRRSQYMRMFQSPGTAERALLDRNAAGLREVFGDADGVDVEHYVTRMQQPGVLTSCLNWYRAQELADVEGLGPIEVPTLYVWSDDDVALGPVAAQATASHVRGPYRFEILNGVSHWVPEQAANELTRWLLEHLAAHPD